MRFILKSGILIFVLIIFIVGGGLVWWKINSEPVSKIQNKVGFVVNKGSSAAQIGNNLYINGLIKNPLAFKIYVQLFDKAGRINAGEFELSSDMSLKQIVSTLQGGPKEVWVTIPEGLRREEVVERFIQGLEKKDTEADFFRSGFLTATQDKEGYLFPDTYLFPKEVSAQVVAQKMFNVFDAKLNDKMKTDIAKSNFSLNDTIILASIIERETKSVDEKPVVAGILIKRLKTAGWLMQADATVQYAVASARCLAPNAQCNDWWPILTKDDLEINSPYNSYKYKKLIPTAIASPGIASIQAVVYPQESDFWFYIHDANGNIHFAKTVQEHNQNIRKYLNK